MCRLDLRSGNWGLGWVISDVPELLAQNFRKVPQLFPTILLAPQEKACGPAASESLMELNNLQCPEPHPESLRLGETLTQVTLSIHKAVNYWVSRKK